MTPSERHARKQVLLARIAFERHELKRDVTQLHRSAQPSAVLRAAVGKRFSGPLGRRLFSGGVPAGSDVLTQALGWLRRYRGIAALVGGALPMLRGGGRWKRLLRIAVIGGASWLGWRATRKR